MAKAKKVLLNLSVQQIFLRVGLILLVLGGVLVFPLESRSVSDMEQFTYTYICLLVGILTLLIGLFGVKNFYKGFLFLVLCITVSMLLIYLYLVVSGHDGWGSGLVVFWWGLPCGAITGILFLIINHAFIRSKCSGIKLYVLQAFILIAIYAVVLYISNDFEEKLRYLESII